MRSSWCKRMLVSGINTVVVAGLFVAVEGEQREHMDKEQVMSDLRYRSLRTTMSPQLSVGRMGKECKELYL